MKLPILSLLFISLFGVTAVLLSDRNGDYHQQEAKLQHGLGDIPGWRISEQYELLDVILEELKLDDYVHRTYIGSKGDVTLYIGYYHTSKKVGAAHDPMVCFPGQGWEIQDPGKGKFSEFNDRKYGVIRYSTMIAIKGETPLLLLYWFQAFDEAVNSTFVQKLILAGKSFAHMGEENAFVRLSTPCPSRKYDECRSVLIDFVKDFYPKFYDYVVDGNPNSSKD